jgi:hypothetical protein
VTIKLNQAASGSTSLTSVSIPMPSGSYTTGDLLLVTVAHDQAGTSTAVATVTTGWTRVFYETTATATVASLTLFAKVATSASEANLVVTGSNNDYVRQITVVDGARLPGGFTVSSIVHATKVTATAANADPPSLSLTAGNSYHVFAAASVDLTANGNSISAVPSGYTLQSITKSATSTTSVALGLAYKSYPDTFTSTSNAYVAKTFAVPVTPVPLGPLTETLTDDFTGTTLNTTKWPASSGATQNNELIITAANAADRFVVSAGTYGFRNTFVLFENIAFPAGVSECALFVRDATGNKRYLILKIGTNLSFIYQINTVDQGTPLLNQTYNATNDKWWKIAEDNGTVRYSTSPTGAAGSWTQRYTFTTDLSWGRNDAQIYIDCWTGTTGELWKVDNLNLPPAAGGKGVVAMPPRIRPVLFRR